jgi:hypothetical protein
VHRLTLINQVHVLKKMTTFIMNVPYFFMTNKIFQLNFTLVCFNIGPTFTNVELPRFGDSETTSLEYTSLSVKHTLPLQVAGKKSEVDCAMCTKRRKNTGSVPKEY